MTTTELLTYDFSASELSELTAPHFLIAVWKEKGIAIVEYIKTLNVTPQPMENFLNFCTPCGGRLGWFTSFGVERTLSHNLGISA